MTTLRTTTAGSAGWPEPAAAVPSGLPLERAEEGGLHERIDVREEDDELLDGDGLDPAAAPDVAGKAPDRVASGKKRPAATSSTMAARVRNGPASESLE